MMRDYLKKYLKEIGIGFILILCAFTAVNNVSTSEKKELETAALIGTYKKDPLPFSIEEYPLHETTEIHNKLDALLKRINKRNDFHGAILVAKNEKILYKNQIGIADFREKKPLNKNSVFQLASVSKQFTAAAIMILNEQNKLQLTDTINRFFPNFPYKNITIKNLLNHTAGLPNYFWIAEHQWEEDKPPTNSEMMTFLESTNVYSFFKPGRNFDYSNTGYFVLASIIEKVSGISFADFIKQHIFDPLQMSSSFVYSYENDSIRENQLEGYRLYRGWRHLKIRSTVNDAIVGDKNIYTTAEDLFKWTYGLNSGKLISKESLDLMYAKGETIYGRKIPYGFGFRIDNKRDNTIYHYGKWNGFSTALTKYIEEDLVIIILEHTSYKAMKSLNNQIKRIITESLAL